MANLVINGGSQTLDGTKAYDNVTITNGGILYVTAYNGTGTTGWLILNVTGNVTLDATSSINGEGRGYTGGGGGGGGWSGGGGGTSNLGGNGYNGAGASNPMHGGGGGGGTGSGATGGSGGTGGGGTGGGGAGGAVIGNNLLDDTVYYGGGGGGGGGGGLGYTGGGEYNWSYQAGFVGNLGGAALIINAANVVISGTINLKGGAGGAGGYGSYGYNTGGGGGGGGGGASGGSLKINASSSIDISSSIINLSGGAGGAGGAGGGYNIWESYGAGSSGATGAGGRLKVFGATIITTGATITAGTVYYELTVGSASFTSNPSNARIWIDDEDTGINTSNTIPDLSAGSHNYTLKLAGYLNATGSFSVTTGQTTIVPLVTLILITCPIVAKYSGDTITLQATPKDGIGPYYVVFKKGIGIIDPSRLGNQPNPILSASENVQITRIYTLDDVDIAGASGGTINFSVYMTDSCPTGPVSCTETCTITIGCVAPVCNFTVT